jgi:hypothetical protein
MRATFLTATVCCLALMPLAAMAQQVTPGQWSVSSRVTHVEGPGLPPSIADAMTSEPADTDTRCVTAKEAAAGLQEILKEKDQNCSMTNTSFTGGVLDATRACRGNGGESVIHLRGPIAPTGFTLSASGTGPHGMKMTMIFTAKRIGACK